MPGQPQFHVDMRRDSSDDVTLALEGELDFKTAPVLVERAREALDQRPPRLVLDLAELQFMDCSGLGAVRMVAREQRAREPDSQVVVRSPGPTVRRLLDILGPGSVPGFAEVA